MKINQHTSLSSDRILLVPYSKHHVPTYHNWMQDPDLQAATASEPLSMEEEYAMQRSWRTDHDKLTFIICLPLSGSGGDHSPIEVGVDDAEERMVGDINLFLFDDDDVDGYHGDERGSSGDGQSRGMVGEIELMIARKNLRRKGCGRAALLVFLMYVVLGWENIGEEYAGSKGSVRLSYLRVKINQENVGSIALFESVGFLRTAEGANYFGEVELRWTPAIGDLRARGVEYQTLVYPDTEWSR